MKRGGGRRYYRPEDVDLLRGIRQILYGDGYTIKGAQRILKERGVRHVVAIGRGEETGPAAEPRLSPPAGPVAADPLTEYAPKHLREQSTRPAPADAEGRDARFGPEQEDDRGDAAVSSVSADGDRFGDETRRDARFDDDAPQDGGAVGLSLDGDAEKALRAVLGELQECRRILRDLRENSGM